MDIVEVISRDTDLRRAGKQLTGRCPFHDEKTPSFFVNPDKQLYYCFGCHAGGDLITYLRTKHGLSFRAAAHQAGRELKDYRYAPQTAVDREKVEIRFRFMQWQRDFARNLTRLHDEIELAEIAYRSITRAPEVWPEEEQDYWITYLGDLYGALSVAQHENDMRKDVETEWKMWLHDQEDWG